MAKVSMYDIKQCVRDDCKDVSVWQNLITTPNASELWEQAEQLIKEEDYLEFDDHPLSTIKDLMDPERPAPWDHLNNSDNDDDLDVEIEEYVEK